MISLEDLKKVKGMSEYIEELKDDFNFDIFGENYATQIKNTLELENNDFTVDKVLNFDDEKLNNFIKYLIYLELTKEKEVKAEEKRTKDYKNAKELGKNNNPYNYNKHNKIIKNEKLIKLKTLLNELKKSSEKFEELKPIIYTLNFEELNELFKYSKDINSIRNSDEGIVNIKGLDITIIGELYLHTFFENKLFINNTILKQKINNKKGIFKLLYNNRNLYTFIRENFNIDNIDILKKYIRWILIEHTIGIKKYTEYYIILKKYIFNYIDIDDGKEKMSLDEVFENNDSVKKFLKEAN